jgi:2-polyprenyl-3-methyl-5-hydroxy-6-metoxy-1,4-benzoquinol methylase
MALTQKQIQRQEGKDAHILKSTTFEFICTTYDLGHKRVLDIGCGYGGYMQRFGPKSVGVTTREEEVEYGKLKGRDVRIGNAELLKESIRQDERFDVIWCNNIFEHLLSPHAFLVKLKEFAHEDTLLILGTPIVPIFPLMRRLPRFGGAISHSHINFFNYITYTATVQYAGWKQLSLRSFFFKNKILDAVTHYIAPHLYMIAKNDASYRYSVKKAAEWLEDPYYKEMLDIMGYESSIPHPTKQN